MPIVGLTDQKRPTFPKVGDIRKGAEKGEKRPGKDLTYFRYVAIEGEEEAAEAFHEDYGDEPREINVVLPFDEIDRNLEAWMERYTSGALQCRGDGTTCTMWRDGDGEMRHEKRACGELPECDDCRPSGRLKVIIPELRRLAYVTVHTTSKWDIVELTENLRALRQLTGNGLKGIPLVLKRRPREISTPRADGKRVRQTKWLLSIEADQRWVDQSLRQIEAAATPGAAQLEAGSNLEHNVNLLTGEVGEIEEVEGELVDEEPKAASDNGSEPKSRGQIASEDVTAKGTVLGQCGPDELNAMLDWANGLDEPGDKALELKGHVEVLLDYLAEHEASGEQEQMPF